MIVDLIKNKGNYKFGSVWEKTFNFLLSITLDTKEGEYKIQNDDIFAKIISYKTRNLETSVLEAHRKHIDIHLLLSGKEKIEWFPIDILSTKTKYDETKDVEFFNHPCSVPGHVDLSNGIFVVLFPQDAHMPSLTIGDAPESVKKVVIKIKTDIFL